MTTDHHPIRVEANPNRVVVRLGEHVIADTRSALTLFEAAYAGVRYVPRDDVDMTLFMRTSHTTQCPFKGQASYYTVKSGGRTAESGVWTYQDPKPVAAKVAGYLAFDPRWFDLAETPAS